MARSKALSYSHFIVQNLYTINVSRCSPNTKIAKSTTRLCMLPSTTVGGQTQRAFCKLTGNQERPPPPLPASLPSSSWKKWTTGMVVAIVIPVLQFKEEVDEVMEKVEQIIDVVEVVAEAVDVAAANIADGLPEGSKLKTTVGAVEEVAEKIAGKAHKAEDFINEVQKTEDKLTSIIDPIKP